MYFDFLFNKNDSIPPNPHGLASKRTSPERMRRIMELDLRGVPWT
jgi:hypothetical protein